MTTNPDTSIAKPLHVAYLINQYPAVSHTFIKREIQALERCGVQVTRYALRGWDAELVDDSDRAEQQKTRYVLQRGVPALLIAVIRRLITSPLRLLSATKAVVRMSRSSDTNIVIHLAYLAEACVLHQWLVDAGANHLHAHFATNPAEIALLVRALGGLPFSFTAHGSDIMDRPAQMNLESKVADATFVAAVCSFGRNQIFRWVPYSLWGKVAVVRCGLQAGYGDEAEPPSARQMRLVCVGRLSKEKGQPLLIQAAALLHAAGTPVEITLVGDGPMRAELEKMITFHGLTGCVHITGWLDSQGIENQLQQARGLVVSSLSEGLPVVIMEAMANRRPVIAPYLSGIPELVISGATGWLYPAGDVGALASAMKACIDAPAADLSELGERAHRRVWESHNIDTETQKLLALMSRSVLSTHEADA